LWDKFKQSNICGIKVPKKSGSRKVEKLFVVIIKKLIQIFPNFIKIKPTYLEISTNLNHMKHEENYTYANYNEIA
jgi:hypothetical protein